MFHLQLSKKASVHSFIHFVNIYSTSSRGNFKKLLNCKRNRLPTTQFASFINSKFASYCSDFCSNQLGSWVICCKVKENMRQKYLSLRACCVFAFNIPMWVLPKALMERTFLMMLLFICFFFLELIRNGHDFSYSFYLASYVLEIDPTTEPKN